LQEVALRLATLFIEDMTTESSERTFRITRYRDLSVDLFPTTEMGNAEKAEYNLTEEEISETFWIAEISVSFQFDGMYSLIGIAHKQWIDILYQGSRIGFLLQKDGNTYTWQSRAVAQSKELNSIRKVMQENLHDFFIVKSPL
jgi:hypothetical protein